MQVELTQFGALAILFGVLVVGEVVAKVSKGRIPGALVISILLLVGFWTFLPHDLTEIAGISEPLFTFATMLLITNLATLISRKQMMVQWRTVLISLMGLGAICLITLTLSAKIFGRDIAIAATPPLAGGAIATTLMQQAAMEKGLQVAALVAVITFVMQGLIGYPLTSIFLGKEARRLNTLYKENKLSVDPTAVSEEAEEKDSVFTKIKTSAFILLKLILVSLAAYWTEMLILHISGGAVNISRYVWCLVYGFLTSEVGFLENDALGAAKSDGLTLNILLIYLFGSLSIATPELFFPVALVTIILVLIAAAGMALVAFVASKIFKDNSFFMCYSIILNAFHGFPVNVMLTNEAVEGATDDEKARAAITGQVMPKMLVGGFTSVTVVSVLLAGILINYL